MFSAGSGFHSIAACASQAGARIAHQRSTKRRPLQKKHGSLCRDRVGRGLPCEAECPDEVETPRLAVFDREALTEGRCRPLL